MTGLSLRGLQLNNLMQSSGIPESAIIDLSLQYWFDGLLNGYMSQDSAGTTPAGVGDPVGRWTDRITGYAPDQTTTANKPTRTATGVYFDGGDLLQGAMDDHQPLTLFIVKSQEDALNRVNWEISVGASTNSGYSSFSQGGESYFRVVGSNNTYPTIPSDNQPHIYTMVTTGVFGGACQFRVDGDPGTTVNFPNSDPAIDTITIGANPAGGSNFLGTMHDIIAKHAVMSADEIALVELFLSQRWGVTLA